MSSDLQSALDVLQINNYLAIAGSIAVAYDYLLNLPREIKYIWRRPWTWVSIVYLVVRYVGICSTIADALAGTTFIPGPQMTYASMLTPKVVRILSFYRSYSTHFRHEYFEGIATFVMSAWGLQIFLSAADLIMMLRVYAMWNRSKTVLYSLLLIYIPEVVLSLVFTGIYNDPSHLSVMVVQIIDYTFCNISYLNDLPDNSYHVQLPRFVFSTLLLVLAVFQTLKQSVNMYKATKQWQPNRYMRLFVREGILYFVMDMYFNIVTLLANGGNFTGLPMMFLFSFGYVAICVVIPRFIIGTRELYERDLRGRLQGIDSGFGVVSQHVSKHDDYVSVIEFAGVQEEATEGPGSESEAMQLEERDGRAGLV